MGDAEVAAPIRVNPRMASPARRLAAIGAMRMAPVTLFLSSPRGRWFCRFDPQNHFKTGWTSRSSRRADKSWSRLDAVSEKEGQGGLGVEPPGVQRAHETDEEMRVAKKDVSAGLQIAMATRVKTGAF